MIHADSFLERNNDLLTSEVGGEMVMMSIKEGKYFGTNKVGSYIWKVLEQPIGFDDLCERLANDFSISIDVCKEDVRPFIEELQKVKIINIK